MTWYIIGSIVVFLIIIFLKRNSNKNIFPVLQADIITDNGTEYNVVFTKLEPDTTPIEYIRLILSFISKIYYISTEKEQTRTMILRFLNEISKNNDIETNLKSFQTFSNITQRKMKEKNMKSISAVSYYIDIKTRTIKTKIPITWYNEQMFSSLIVLTEESLKHLDKHQKIILFMCLKNLNKYYSKEPNSDSFSASNTFPNMAYIEAV